MTMGFTYHESVPDVDDKGVGFRADGAPLAAGEHLQPADIVLVEDREGGGIAVGSGAESEVRLLAGWIVVEPHYRVVALEKVPKVPPPHSQAHSKNLHYHQRQPAHRLAVLLIHFPA